MRCEKRADMERFPQIENALPWKVADGRTHDRPPQHPTRHRAGRLPLGRGEEFCLGLRPFLELLERSLTRFVAYGEPGSL
jgi:hypothetical protein